MRLQRLDQDSYATFGELVSDEGEHLFVSLELPWRDNQHGTSCIPQGLYTVQRRYSPRHGMELFGLLDVPGREDVELHVGNLPKDTDGCILVGRGRGIISGQPGITESREAFAAFMASLQGIDSFTLDVLDVQPPEAIA